MTDFNPGIGEDRLVGLESIDGLSFESDGSPISELQLEDVDSLVDRGASVAQLASRERWWRFGHVIVDEAQDLTPMQWRMVTRRARGLSMTVVGDLAQCSTGEPGTWRQHLPTTVADFDYRELTINYRSPSEINELAAHVLARLAPELRPSVAIRNTGHAPRFVRLDDLDRQLTPAVEQISTTEAEIDPRRRTAVVGIRRAPDRQTADVRWLDPWQAKGLEFDHVVLVEPAELVELPRGLSLLYVALTRTTDRLTVVHQRELPAILTGARPEPGSGRTTR